MAPPADPRFRRLLVVDDEPGIRKMMSLDLSADGYQVFTAADGRQGLEVFQAERPDIVLTDLKMPGMDGLELLRLIKAESPDTEVIVITGHGDLELAIRSLQLNAGDFITKPINPDALDVALARAAQRLGLKTELKAYTQDLEERVSQATAKVLASERLAAVGQTVASLAHSIKNMLCGLKGGLYMINQGLTKDQPDRTVGGRQMLERNLHRVDRLVRDLLTLSKPRQPERERVDPAELLSDAVSCMRTQAEDQGVELLVEPAPPDLPCLADRQAVLDSLSNLISNAVDAAATVTGGKVKLRVYPSNGELVWEVADNGPGLDREARERIFEGFYSSKGAAGTGLGLMVTRKNAREHGGRVEYENLPQGGAAFRFILPRPSAREIKDAAGVSPAAMASGEEGCSYDQV